eukprot:COSAG04_NODE_304_length_17311_cov_13.648792_10_plen_131_part_00
MVTDDGRQEARHDCAVVLQRRGGGLGLGRAAGAAAELVDQQAFLPPHDRGAVVAGGDDRGRVVVVALFLLLVRHGLRLGLREVAICNIRCKTAANSQTHESPRFLNNGAGCKGGGGGGGAHKARHSSKKC